MEPKNISLTAQMEIEAAEGDPSTGSGRGGPPYTNARRGLLPRRANVDDNPRGCFAALHKPRHPAPNRCAKEMPTASRPWALWVRKDILTFFDFPRRHTNASPRDALRLFSLSWWARLPTLRPAHHSQRDRFARARLHGEGEDARKNADFLFPVRPELTKTDGRKRPSLRAHKLARPVSMEAHLLRRQRCLTTT